MGNLRGWELPILLAIILLLFGARRLPDLARGVAKSLKIFRSETKGGDDKQGDPGDRRDAQQDDSSATAQDADADGSASGTSDRDTAAPARSGAEPDDDGERPRG